MTSTTERKARAIASRTGVTPGPNSPLLEVSARLCRGEDAEELLCDQFIARISGPRGVVRLSQRRASMITVGVSDRRYRFHQVAAFFEVKAEDGQLTLSQHLFLLDELLHGGYASVGTLDDLRALVEVSVSQPVEGRHARLVEHCRQTIARWAARGFRAERTSLKHRRR